ncbi:MAG: motility protein A [Zetaproteobacteria bacterium CG12_big_fil_rev_8_21_14_0_65_55_1124]|nr:MAG: motility protein A [Zetaproteobacteria bacterium CG1_02_55_237]PIS18690.1 MAG: motility protein A [Zetaproteobacteria bacterium CG08_land_8_20_14_0_20_55_17]PIW43294.1 MAG: motility protein A [Zetaproteobacteria bacterium CG12_big_fil_rev_8_21_14_0_65_55_1124]PIY53425.1 MAG: motility protein A [Zetaproteobacteria bacterium CG_4_10_14_0_8_um_filter_55_43]PIZ38672.1 MAG: motility protein A [Zetaproteobacteria bacterium CG_4_10_14_0_2_um_filter_55_20]PJB82536.1 MAG: motility protein A [Ze
MDIATLIGLATAIGLVITAIQLGGSLASFVDPISFLIVVGGTIGATLVNYPLREVLGAISVGMKTFISKLEDPTKMIGQLIELSQIVRKEGILAMENKVEDFTDPFLKKAIQMAIDGQEPSIIDEILYSEVEKVSERHALGAEIFFTLAGFAPAFGMIGTLVGLVLMLQNMDDPSTIGPSMSVALITTFYGALLANIFFLPMAGKLKTLSKKEILVHEIVISGVQSLVAGENPRVMEQRLLGFLPPKERKTSFE